MNRDANYWRRRMGLPEEHEGNVGAGSSTSGNVGAPSGTSGGGSGGATPPKPVAPTKAPNVSSKAGNVGSSGNVGVGSTS
jgi:hypothetical protein